MNETKFARYRLNDVDAFGTQSEIGEAYDKLTDVIERLEGYEAEIATQPDILKSELSDSEESATIDSGSAYGRIGKLYGESFAEQIVENPKLFGAFDTPSDFKAALEDAGFEVKPLGQGAFKGIPFEDGGGYRINFGDGGLIQYHPVEHSHHGGAYYKISTGKGGTHWYDRDGNEIITREAR